MPSASALRIPRHLFNSLSSQVNEERGLRNSYTAQPQQKWEDKKYGWVPNAKRNIGLSGNKSLPRFYDRASKRGQVVTLVS